MNPDAIVDLEAADVHDFLLERKRAAALAIGAGSGRALLNAPDAESSWFDLYPSAFPAYPQPGAGPIDILAFTLPAGSDGVVKKLAISHIGGGVIDGTGNVVWRVLQNGAAVRGYQNATSQVGSYALPLETFIPLYEGDFIEVTAEVPAGQPPMAAGDATTARVMGYFFPKQRRV